MLTRTHSICHCEERPLIPSSSRDVATAIRLNTRRRTAAATATGLPRYARNDKVGTHEAGGELDNRHLPPYYCRRNPRNKPAGRPGHRCGGNRRTPQMVNEKVIECRHGK